jgi:hypothetical protein
MRRVLLGIALAALTLILLGIGGFVAANWIYVRSFPAILPGFYAKEFCSCRFVMGQPDAYCRIYARQWLPISGVSVDEGARRITVTGLGVTRSARWEGEHYGCRLDG